MLLQELHEAMDNEFIRFKMQVVQALRSSGMDRDMIRTPEVMHTIRAAFEQGLSPEDAIAQLGGEPASDFDHEAPAPQNNVTRMQGRNYGANYDAGADEEEPF